MKPNAPLSFILITALTAAWAGPRPVCGEEKKNPYPDRKVMAADKGTVHIFNAEGKSLWSYRVGGFHDLHMLKNGNVLINRGLQKVVEITPEKKTVWSFDGKKAFPDRRFEIHAFQRLPNGDTMIAVSGPGLIIEVGPDGQINKRIKIKIRRPHPHMDTRLVRKLDNGHYLVCHEGDGRVTEYDAEGKVVWDYDVPLFGKPKKGGHGPTSWGNKVFGAIRLPSGNTLIATGNGHSVLEVTSQKKIVWKIEQNELPGIRLAWVTTLERLPNGNTVIGNCHAGKGQPQLIEVTPEKKVVWTFYNWKELGNAVSNSQVLGVEGKVIR
ncbi:MAG: PQQ-binding-like beta-propeller repeat protein [Phycisphaeraceae bacterium]|nr:PQQ-binding-like beta-propeller repeat protein [Phycisphaeraceae bacterium]